MAKRTAEEKRQTLKRILQYIQINKTATAQEIAKKEKLGLRQAYNYLYDLEALGLIFYNDKLGCWQPGETQAKIEYNSRADYELALKHAKKMLFLDLKPEEREHVEPFREDWARLLASCNAADVPEEIVHSEFMVHIKNFASHLKTGYPEVWLLIEKYRRLQTQTAKNEEIEALENLIYTHIDAIRFRVLHGVPLKGYCELCPTKYITVKDGG